VKRRLEAAQTQVFSEVHCLPHDFQIDVEVAMGDAVSHAPHAAPRYIGMLGEEIRAAIHELGCSLADDD